MKSIMMLPLKNRIFFLLFAVQCCIRTQQFSSSQLMQLGIDPSEKEYAPIKTVDCTDAFGQLYDTTHLFKLNGKQYFSIQGYIRTQPHQSAFYYYKALHAQITQNPSVMRALKDTGTRILVYRYQHPEHQTTDSFFGINAYHKGINLIGQYAMLIRAQLIYQTHEKKLLALFDTIQKKENQLMLPINEMDPLFALFARPLCIDGEWYRNAFAYAEIKTFPRSPLIINQLSRVHSFQEAITIGKKQEAHKHTQWQHIACSALLRYVWVRCMTDQTLKRLFMSTKDRFLTVQVPSAWYGQDAQGTGDNNAGRVLMTLRAFLQQRAAPSLPATPNASSASFSEWFTTTSFYKFFSTLLK